MAKKKEEKDEAQPEEKPQSPSIIKTAMMIGLPLIIIQAGIAYFLIATFVQAPAAVEPQEEVSDFDSTPGFLHTVADVIVNPMGSRGSKFINTSVALEYTDEEVLAELTEKEIQIRDALIKILVSKTVQQLDGAAEKDTLKMEIKDACNQVLKSGKIRRVFFSNFVMQ